MPGKNTKGGKGHKKAKGGGGTFHRELVFKEDGQEYAQVTKVMGDGRFECACFDNTVRIGKIRGKMRKRVWITLNDIVLCGLRDFEEDKIDIIHKYMPDEIKNMKNLGEFPETTVHQDTAPQNLLLETSATSVSDSMNLEDLVSFDTL